MHRRDTAKKLLAEAHLPGTGCRGRFIGCASRKPLGSDSGQGAEEAYDAYRRNAQHTAPGFVAHLLAMPKSEEDIERMPAKLREVDLA